MAQFPAIMLWTDAWVADTHHLSRLERGTYMDLLVLMWRTPGCRVPNDDEWLGKRLKMSPAEVKNELRPLVEEFCKTDGNWITQKRLLAEFSKVAKSCTRQTVRAKARWDKEKKSAAAMHPQPQPQPQPQKKKESDSRVLPFPPFTAGSTPPKSAGAFERFWNAYPRKTKKLDASKAFEKAARQTPAETILAGLARLLPELRQRDPRYVPHAATWLNGARWEDELPKVAAAGGIGVDPNGRMW